jgi:hypothetical protein
MAKTREKFGRLHNAIGFISEEQYGTPFRHHHASLGHPGPGWLRPDGDANLVPPRTWRWRGGAGVGRIRWCGFGNGALAGPVVALDLRKLYLKGLRLIGCTAWDEAVFPSLVAHIERQAIKPLVAEVFALADMARAQQVFLEKRHVGKLVVVPPTLRSTSP